MRPKPDQNDPGQRSVWGFPRQTLAELYAAHVPIKEDGRPFSGIPRSMGW